MHDMQDLSGLGLENLKRSNLEKNQNNFYFLFFLGGGSIIAIIQKKNQNTQKYENWLFQESYDIIGT